MINARLSFLLANDTPLGAARDVCFGYTLGKITLSETVHSPGYLSAAALKAAAQPAPNRDHRQPDRCQNSWVSSWKRPLCNQHWVCFMSRGEGCETSFQSLRSEKRKQCLMNPTGGETHWRGDKALKSGRVSSGWAQGLKSAAVWDQNLWLITWSYTQSTHYKVK